MGSEAYLHCSCGDRTFSARVESRTTAADGVEHDLVFKMDRMHLFDKASGQAIR
jgi:ABC-type sugar transport system ATPase subunit